MFRQLIVNADDFSYTDGVSEGILKAHHQGIVTSTSVMTNTPRFEYWLPFAQKNAPKLGLGLHFTLTSGRPLSNPLDIPDLVTDTHQFNDLKTQLARLPELDIQQVERELQAQFDTFLRVAGNPPDHLDSHHHFVYLRKDILAVMIRLASEYAIPIRKPFPSQRGSSDATVAIAQKLFEKTGFSNENIQTLANAFEALAAQYHIKTPDFFEPGFFGAKTTLGDLLLLLLDLPEGRTELMCHPAMIDQALREVSSYLEPRQQELDSLTQPSARQVIQSEFIQLITYRNL